MANLFRMSWDFLDTNIGLPAYFLQNTAQCRVDLSGTLSRTGIGCLVIDSGAFGPVWGMPSLPGTAGFFWGGAVWPNVLADSSGFVVFGLATLPPPNIIDINTIFYIMGDGSIKVVQGNGTTQIGRTAAGIITSSAWNYIEVHVIESSTVGSVEIRVNGVTRLTLTNVNTQPRPTASNGFQLLGFGGGGAYRHDDTYLNDSTGPAPFNGFLGPIEVKVGAPIADSTPLQMTPSTPGAHYVLVATIPEQIVTNVQDAVVGQTDQYLYSNGSILDSDTILALSHELYMGLAAAGTGSAGSSVAGAAAPSSVALSTTPIFQSTIRVTNPQTGVSWVKGDLATTPLGPIVVTS
jgi:hypothetical protein